MASGMTPAKRFAVRTSLVAGSTLAIVLGAQSLILLDTASSNPLASNAASVVNTTTSTTADSVDSEVATSTVSTVRQASPDTTTTNVVAAAPTAQPVQQAAVRSVPTTHSSR
jgi:hypothetical protein